MTVTGGAAVEGARVGPAAEPAPTGSDPVGPMTLAFGTGGPAVLAGVVVGYAAECRHDTGRTGAKGAERTVRGCAGSSRRRCSRLRPPGR